MDMGILNQLLGLHVEKYGDLTIITFVLFWCLSIMCIQRGDDM